MNLPTQAALARYGAVKVTTANPGQLLVMLCDGFMRFVREAQTAMVAKDKGKAGERISRAHAIVAHLLATLDKRHAPELCEKLEGVYGFCMRRLLQANLSQNAEMLGEVLRVFAPLRDAWANAVAQVATGSPSPR